MIKKIYEHLITKKKYNTLKLKYDVLKEEYEHKVVELNTERRINAKRKKIWTDALKEQEEKIIELRRKKTKK